MLHIGMFVLNLLTIYLSITCMYHLRCLIYVKLVYIYKTVSVYQLCTGLK